MNYVNMAAPSRSMQWIPKLSRFSRALLFRRQHRRLGSCQLSTTVTEDMDEKPHAMKPASEEIRTDTVEADTAKTEETATPQQETVPSELENKLTSENKKLKADVKETKDKYMRALAETENVRTRMRKQVEDVKVFGIQGFCKDLLDVADTLYQAMETVPAEQLRNNQHLKALYDGLAMTNKQMVNVFGNHGLVKIDPVIGEKFDPFFHEAMFQVPVSGKHKGDTVAVIQKTGYKLQDRTLRPALVGVFKS